MSNKLKICLVGCGRIALSHLNGAKQSQKVEIVALVDTKLEQAQSYAERYGIACAAATVEEAAQQCQFDAVDICLPNFLHKEMALRAIALGKHVLVEKPLANNVADCRAIVDAAKEKGVTLMTGQSRRYYPAVLASKATAGRVHNISAELYGFLAAPPTPWWKSAESTGGLMLPLWGNHIFDYILWMFDELPQSVYCVSQRLNPIWEGEDEVMAILTFSEGRHANVRMSWNTRLNDDSWNGEGKILSSKDIHYQRLVLGENGTCILQDETTLLHNGRPVVEDSDEISNFCRELEEFATAIEEKRAPLTDGLIGLNNVLLQEACLKSAAEGRVMHLKGDCEYV